MKERNVFFKSESFNMAAEISILYTSTLPKFGKFIIMLY